MATFSARTLIATGLVVGGFLVAWNWQSMKYDRRIADIRSAHSEALAESEKRMRDIESGWHAAMTKVQEDARQAQADIDADLAAAGNELKRLRERSRLYSSRAAENTPASCRSTPATSALVLYSQLLDQCEARNISYSEEADRRRVAALACEAAYDEVSGAPQ